MWNQYTSQEWPMLQEPDPSIQEDTIQESSVELDPKIAREHIRKRRIQVRCDLVQKSIALKSRGKEQLTIEALQSDIVPASSSSSSIDDLPKSPDNSHLALRSVEEQISLNVVDPSEYKFPHHIPIHLENPDQQNGNNNQQADLTSNINADIASFSSAFNIESGDLQKQKTGASSSQPAIASHSPSTNPSGPLTLEHMHQARGRQYAQWRQNMLEALQRDQIDRLDWCASPAVLPAEGGPAWEDPIIDDKLLFQSCMPLSTSGAPLYFDSPPTSRHDHSQNSHSIAYTMYHSSSSSAL